MAVIEVKYLDSTGQPDFDFDVGYFYNKVSPALQTCASPGLYFHASDSDSSTLGATFNAVASKLRSATYVKK